MPLLTDVPKVEEQFRRTTLTENIQTMTTANSSNTNRANPLRCYTITPIDLQKQFRNDYHILTIEEPLPPLDRQLNFIALSQAMFNEAKPASIDQLDILDEAYLQIFIPKTRRS